METIITYNKTQALTLELIQRFKPLTTKDKKRLNTAIDRLITDIMRVEQNEKADSGLYGKVSEILGQSKHSKALDVHSQNKKDGYIFIDNVRYSLEHKTNYTDINEYINKSADWLKTHYIRYTINDCTKAVTNKKTGHITPSKKLEFEGVLSFADWFEIGYKFNAIKPHRTSNGEIHTYYRHSLKLCKYLNSLNIVPFNRNGEYVKEDFIIEY